MAVRTWPWYFTLTERPLSIARRKNGGEILSSHFFTKQFAEAFSCFSSSASFKQGNRKCLLPVSLLDAQRIPADNSRGQQIQIRLTDN